MDYDSRENRRSLPRHIAYIACSYPPNPIVADQILIQKITREFVSRGIQVTIVGTRYNVDRLDAPHFEDLDGNPSVKWVTYGRTPGFASHVTSSLRSRFLGYNSILGVDAVVDQLRTTHADIPGPDLVLSQYNPEHAIDIGCLFARKLGLPWIHIHNDPYPRHLAPAPFNIPKPHWTQRPGVWRQSRRAFVLPDRVVFPCQRLLEFQQRILPRLAKSSPRQWLVIPHMGIRPTKLESGDNVFRVCHIGRLYANARSPAALIQAWRLFVRDLKGSVKTELLQIGGGGKDFLPMFENVPSARVLPTVSHSESLALMKKASVLVLVEGSLEEGIYLPSKLPDYVGSRRPILALSPRDGTVADLFSQYGGGLLADPFDPETARNALHKLLENWRTSHTKAGAVYPALEEYFHPDHVCDLFFNVFDEVLVEREHRTKSVQQAGR